MKRKPKQIQALSTQNILPQEQKTLRKTIWDKLPLFLSLIAILLTYINNCNQDKKWEKLNLGKIDIKSVDFFNYREITSKDLKDMTWGYNAFVTNNPTSAAFDPNKLFVFNTIVAYNVKTKEYVRSPFTVTIHEMEGKLREKNIYDTVSWQYLKHYQIVIELQNIGATECRLTNQVVKYFDSTKSNKEISFILGNKTNVVNANKSSFSKFEMDVPLELSFPHSYKLEITYLNINNEEIIKKVSLLYVENEGWEISDYN